jgi:thymidylate kinase
MTKHVITVGLEAHDGTGKSSLSAGLREIFDGDVRLNEGQYKEERDLLIERWKGGEITLQELDAEMTDSYQKETEEINLLIESTSRQIVILDRTWASFAADLVEDYKKENVKFPHFGRQDSIVYPGGVLKPTVTFELKIHEDRRNKQVEERDERLSERDEKLRDDPIYRDNLEKSRKRLGCVRLLMRERNKPVSALRAAQVLLGSRKAPPLRIYPQGPLFEL